VIGELWTPAVGVCATGENSADRVALLPAR
jgi:hypothetical protein